MQRLIAHHTVVPGGKVLINHVVTLADNGVLLHLAPFHTELPGTHYVGTPLVLMPIDAPPLPDELRQALRSPRVNERNEAIAKVSARLARRAEAIVNVTRLAAVY